MPPEDNPADDEPNFPCDKCNGMVLLSAIHYSGGGYGDPPDPCCDQWQCQDCGAIYRQCEFKKEV